MLRSTKRCSHCHADKPIHEFLALRGSYEYAYCRACTSEYQKNRRDSTRSVVEPTSCAICGLIFDKENRPCRDHNHTTGQDRDWLCYACNVALGQFKDNPLLLEQAIEYLRVHSGDNMTVFVDKKILTAYEVEDQTQCQCGGFKNVVHCPKCGSTQCYANKRASPQALLPGAQLPTQVRAFRCKLCSELFSEVDTVNACKAKKNWQQNAEREQRTHRSLEKAPPEQQQKLLKDYLEAHPERRAQISDPTLKKLFEPPKLDEGGES